MRTYLPAILVVLVLAAAALAGVAWHTIHPADIDDSIAAGGVPASIPIDSLASSADSEAAAAAAVLASDCRRNEFGIHQKVIATRRGIRCLDQVPDGVLAPSSLAYFSPHYVFDQYPASGDPQFFLLGTTPQRHSLVGWAPAVDLARWDTRYGGLPGSLLVYRDPEALEELIRTGSTGRPPIARARSSDSTGRSPWPIAESRQLTIDGRVHEIVRLQFLGRWREGSELGALQASRPAYAAQEVESYRLSLRQVDIVFVVDNTLSTRPFVQAIQDAVQAIVQLLRAAAPAGDTSVPLDVAFGLVLYRDHRPGLMFGGPGGALEATQVCFDGQLVSDPEQFCASVRTLQAADVPSQDWAEAGLDGIHRAITSVQWRGEGLSDRVIVRIGDNSAHDQPGPDNPLGLDIDQVVALARARQQIKLFSLCLRGGGGYPEQHLHWVQCRRLAAGTDAECLPLDNVDEVSQRLVDVLRTEHARVADYSEQFEALRSGQATLQELVAARNVVDLEQKYNLLDFLEGAGIDVERLGPDVPTFASGWCLVDHQGVTLLKKYVYISRAELDFLIGELHSLSRFLSPDLARNLAQRSGEARIDPQSFLHPRQPDTLPFDVLLQRNGLPVSRGILSFTRGELDAMSEERRAVLREELARRIIPRLTNFRNSDAFDFLDDQEVGWIPEELLP